MSDLCPDELAFLDQIADQPDDDTTRLVYADWLEEHDRVERADGIRRFVASPARFTFSEGSAAQLSYTGKRPDLPATVCITLAVGYAGVSWTTYKGLIESAKCTWERWFQIGDGLLKRNWCPEIVLTEALVMPSVMIEPVLRSRWPAVKRWSWTEPPAPVPVAPDVPDIEYTDYHY